MARQKKGAMTAWPPGLDRITFEPGKMGGRACIRGLRITVGMIVSLVAEGVKRSGARNLEIPESRQ